MKERQDWRCFNVLSIHSCDTISPAFRVSLLNKWEAWECGLVLGKVVQRCVPGFSDAMEIKIIVCYEGFVVE